MIEKFWKNTWCIPMKNENSQTITDDFLYTLTASKREANKKESERGAEFCNSVFRNFLKLKVIHHFSTFFDKGPH